MKTDETYNNARRKAQILKEFYSHLSTYLVVNGIFFLVNYLTSPGEWWVLFPLIGWGICLTIHGIDTVVRLTGIWEKWEFEKTKKFMRKGLD